MRFLADEMLKKTCRWLRILGIDCEFVEGLKDDVVMVLAKKKRRVLLTGDVALFRCCYKRKIPVLLLEGNAIEGHLMKIANAFSLKFLFPLSTRCPKCNSLLRKIGKKNVKGKVYARVYANNSLFWKCKKCNKLYWEGTHWKSISKVGKRLAQTTSSIERARAL